MRNAIFPQCFEHRRSRQVGQQGRSTKDRKGIFERRVPRLAVGSKADLKHIRRWMEKSSICSLSRDGEFGRRIGCCMVMRPVAAIDR
jgi:hypothetical protein